MIEPTDTIKEIQRRCERVIEVAQKTGPRTTIRRWQTDSWGNRSPIFVEGQPAEGPEEVVNLLQRIYSLYSKGALRRNRSKAHRRIKEKARELGIIQNTEE